MRVSEKLKELGVRPPADLINQWDQIVAVVEAAEKTTKTARPLQDAINDYLAPALAALDEALGE